MYNTVENIVPKEEISHYEQLLLMSQWFQKSTAAEASESVGLWEKVNPFSPIKLETNLFLILNS